jgi:hypothetical protein
MLTPNQHPEISVLEELWNSQFGSRRSTDISGPLNDFLHCFSEQVKAQPALKPYVDSRALENLHDIAKTSNAQVDLQSQMVDQLGRISSILERIPPKALSHDQAKESKEWLATSYSLIRPRILNCLHRERLITRLVKALPERAVFLHADAGYGKTWLVQDFIETDASTLVVWYTFFERAVSALQLIEELASELVRQTNTGGIRTLAYLRDRGADARPEEALASLIDELGELSSIQSLFVFEDLHHISSDTSIGWIIELLASHRPSDLRLILTSRYPLPFSQAKLLAQGQLTVIDGTELAFDLEELQSYLNNILELDLSEEQTQYLYKRTGGWIAAVSLAAEALKTVPLGGIEELVQRLTGFDGNIYDFFADEVYNSLDVQRKWLLKRIGLARIVQPAIVDLFTARADGGQVLRDLARENTFLIQDATDSSNYRFHSLFSEFLEARFQDEEGNDAVKYAHGLLALFYTENNEWYLVTRHAIAAEEYELAIQCLEKIVPAGMNLGYGQLVLSMLKELPDEWLEQSALLLETRGMAALQVSDLDLAMRSFSQAEKLYREAQDRIASNRLRFLNAETQLKHGDIQPETFIRIAHQVAQDCYEQNEVLLGIQVELRLIAIGQTISTKYDNLLSDLADRSDQLVLRLSQLDEVSPSVKARALATQAHLLFQIITSASLHATGRIRMRSEMGHPVPLEERVRLARIAVEGWQRITDLYTEAERITREESEIEWAIICQQHVTDNVYHFSQTLLIVKTQPEYQREFSVDGFNTTQVEKLLKSFFGILQRCASIFAKYHMVDELATTYCEAADIYDILGDFENRNKLAQQAFNLANDRNLSDISIRAQRLLDGQNTFSSVSKGIERELGDEAFASMSEENREAFLDSFLRAFADDVDNESIRKSMESDLDDIIAAAKMRIEWCQYVQIIQDLEHTRSLQTMYRTIPKKWIICTELQYRSPAPGYSFDDLWPMFKGIYCLGCLRRSLKKDSA